MRKQHNILLDVEIQPSEENNPKKDVRTQFCKWIYVIKTKPDGSIERQKGQWLAQRFSQ